MGRCWYHTFQSLPKRFRRSNGELIAAASVSVVPRMQSSPDKPQSWYERHHKRLHLPFLAPISRVAALLPHTPSHFIVVRPLNCCTSISTGRLWWWVRSWLLSSCTRQSQIFGENPFSSRYSIEITRNKIHTRSKRGSNAHSGPALFESHLIASYRLTCRTDFLQVSSMCPYWSPDHIQIF